VTATDSSKSKNRCTIYREGPAFFRRRKCKISFMRRTSFVLALKHPNGTKFAFTSYILHKLNASLTNATGHRFVQLLLQSFAGYDSVAMDILPCFSAKRRKRTRRLLFFRRHLNKSCGMYCVIKLRHYYPCVLFRDALTYKLIQNDRTCQQVIETIN